MAVIDMRDDLRGEVALSSSIGQGIGSAVGGYVGFKVRERRKQEIEKGILSVLNRQHLEGLTDDETRLEMFKIKDIVDQKLSPWVQEQVEAATGTGRHHVSESEKARTAYWQSRAGGSAGTLDTFTKYQKIANDATKQLNDARTIAETNKTDLDPTMVAALEGQIEYGRRGMAQFMPTKTAAPQARADVDAVTGSFPVTGRPPEQATDNLTVPPSPPTIIDPAAAAMEGPSDQLNITDAFSGAGLQPSGFAQAETPQQTKADAAITKALAPEAPEAQAEPPTQEIFEQTVRQMAQTDRAAAKAYYNKWVTKWQ